ncbi:hypothetical protein C8Q80DRAFT_77102 [Daedaleopsis nitida]|nr:hypothetical protein C8Q80DRAFT_77102 [Daedaleopsis nitida]
MAQPSASPTPNVLKPPIATSPSAHPPNLLFYPRKEFLRDQPRVYSSFSLLTLAGQNLVRLYSFPDSVINGFRRFFDSQDLITGCRESAASHFFEFALEDKPWSNVKSLASEKLIVSILSVIYQYGFTFLSTIEYAREQDDRIALAFSRPTTAPVNSSIPVVPNGSVSTLPQVGPMLFAVSFPSTALLRVIEPPLPLTPAILQAVRNAWPRGIAVEKKIGDSYEFKLKGYKWFQENTFSVDSLQQILSLLAALDRNSFTLLTSLTMGSRSRTRDLWIFVGPPSENHSVDSVPASPTGSSLELKREVTPQHGLGGILPDSQPQHGRPTSPHMSSPLKQVTPSHSNSSNSKLKKPFPKAQLPLAFQSDSSLNNAGRLSSEIGSVDMTGVGTAHRRGGTQPTTPDVFYTTGPVKPGNVYQQEFNPWNRSVAPPVLPLNPNPPPPAAQFLTAPFGRQHSRHYSMSSTDDPLFRASVQDSPYDIARQSSSSISSRARRASSPLSGSPINLLPQSLRISPSTEAPPPAGRHSSDGVRPDSLTPPLLGPGAFRDSAFSSSTGWRSTEIPITWTGKDPEPSPHADTHLPQPSPPRVAPLGPRERRQSSGTSQPQLERRGSAGPALPGAWAATPQEEKRQDDVVSDSTPPLTTSSSTSPSSSNMIPPTIKEQPSQEGDEVSKHGSPAYKNVVVAQPRPKQAEGEGARKSEAAWVGNTMDRQALPPNGTLPKAGPLNTSTNTAKPSPPGSAANGNAYQQRRPNATRSNSISEGWVLINIDGKVKAGSRTSGQNSAHSPPPLKHQRSQSDSRVPTMHNLAQTTAGAGKSTMSPAAKAIVMVDAIGVKETAREKAQSGGKLRRLLGRSGDKSTSHTPEPSTSSGAVQQAAKGKSGQPQSHSQGNGAAQASAKGKQTPQANAGTVKGRK